MVIKARRGPLRHWNVQEKRRIVEETFLPGASVSVIARRHDVNSNMLFRWRREYQRGAFGPAPAAPKGPEFVSVGFIGDDGRLVQNSLDTNLEAEPRVSDRAATDTPKLSAASSSLTGRVELELPGRVRFTFDATLDDAALRRLVTIIKELA
jgi:transposase-like protein